MPDEARRPRRTPETTERRRLWTLGISLGVMMVMVLGPPLVFLTLPDPRPSPVPSIDAAGMGVYASGDTGTWRLFPRTRPVNKAPKDAPTLFRLDSIVVVARHPDDPRRYRLALLPQRNAIRSDFQVEPTRVIVYPPDLRGGVYEIGVPRDSGSGGTDYYYVRVVAP